MVPLGLSVADRKRYESALLHTHRINIDVRIHDSNEQVISTVTSHVLGGSVQVDMSQAPHRTLELHMLQPRTAPAWLPKGPGDAHIFADNFVSVRYKVWVDDLSDGPGWVEVPVFWGPIVGLSQDGDQITITGSGKEILGLDPHLLWDTMVVREGQKRTTAIRDVLAAKGETRFDLPDLNVKVGKRLGLNRHAQVWRVAKHIAGGADWQLFYDGRGRVRARRWPQNRVWTFHGGANGDVLTKPNISYDVESVRNIVEVLGPEPKGPPQRIRAVARAAAKHPMSPESMKRNGKKRFLVHLIDSNLTAPDMEWHSPQKVHLKRGGIRLNPGHWGAPSGVKNPRRWLEHAHHLLVTRRRKAQDIADRQLKQRLKAAVEASFDTLPIPHLEEGDVCAVYTDGMHFEFILKQFTIPLTADAPMSIGVNKKVSWRGKKRKHKRRAVR